MLDFEVSATIKRAGAGNFVNGRYAAATPTELPIQTSIPQPLRGNQVLILPEARRTEESYILYTEFKLRTDNENDSKLPCDILVWRGNEYEVHNVKDWTDTDIPHYEVIIIRKEIVNKYEESTP